MKITRTERQIEGSPVRVSFSIRNPSLEDMKTIAKGLRAIPDDEHARDLLKQFESMMKEGETE